MRRRSPAVKWNLLALSMEYTTLYFAFTLDGRADGSSVRERGLSVTLNPLVSEINGGSDSRERNAAVGLDPLAADGASGIRERIPAVVDTEVVCDRERRAPEECTDRFNTVERLVESCSTSRRSAGLGSGTTRSSDVRPTLVAVSASVPAIYVLSSRSSSCSSSKNSSCSPPADVDAAAL